MPLVMLLLVASRVQALQLYQIGETQKPRDKLEVIGYTALSNASGTPFACSSQAGKCSQYHCCSAHVGGHCGRIATCIIVDLLHAATTRQ